MARVKEDAVVRDIVEFLTLALYPRTWFGVIPGGHGRKTIAAGYKSGTPDVLVIDRDPLRADFGRAILFEAKRPVGGIVSDEQHDCHADLDQAGARVFVVTSSAEVESALRLLNVPMRVNSQPPLFNSHLSEPNARMIAERESLGPGSRDR